GRPDAFDITRPDFGAGCATERLHLFRLNGDVDAFVIHRAARRGWRVERGDPHLVGWKERQRNGNEFPFRFGAQTRGAGDERDGRCERKYRGSNLPRHYSLWDNSAFVSHQTILVLDFGSQYTQLIA